MHHTYSLDFRNNIILRYSSESPKKAYLLIVHRQLHFALLFCKYCKLKFRFIFNKHHFGISELQCIVNVSSDITNYK